MKYSLVICIGAFFLASALCVQVKLCEHKDYRGRCITPNISRLCHDFRDFDNMASSIDTNGECVLIWRYWGCVGENRRVAPGTSSHGDLAAISFDDRTSSIQLCPKEMRSVRLCEDPDHKRCSDHPISERCQSIVRLDDKISSADTRGNCMILWDRRGCSGEKRRVVGSVRNFDSIRFNDKASSIQLCPRVELRYYDDSDTANTYSQVTWGNGNSIKQIGLNGHARIKIYMHGYDGSGTSENTRLIKNNYLSSSRNQPVLIVHWEPLACKTVNEYSVVAQNHVPIVAAYVREFLSDMLAHRVISSFNQTHLIGNGLGGQMAGLIGQGIQDKHCGRKVGRISGLDPSGPDYLGRPANERLDESDAHFVDAIHSSLLAGYFDRVANADFFEGLGRPERGNYTRAARLFALSITDRTIVGCRVTGEGRDRNCTHDCNKSVVFGEHIDENVRGEYCFNRNLPDD